LLLADAQMSDLLLELARIEQVFPGGLGRRRRLLKRRWWRPLVLQGWRLSVAMRRAAVGRVRVLPHGDDRRGGEGQLRAMPAERVFNPGPQRSRRLRSDRGQAGTRSRTGPGRSRKAEKRRDNCVCCVQEVKERVKRQARRKEETAAHAPKQLSRAEVS